MKYKVGDKVRVRKDLQVHDYAGKVASYSMTEYAGDEVTIRTRSGDSCGKYYTIEEDGGRYAWTETMFEDKEKPNDNDSIRILANGNKVTAIHMETGKKGVARCHPDDDFDFFVGAKIALERLEETEKPYGWLKDGATYYTPDVASSKLYTEVIYDMDTWDMENIKRGIVFKTKEEAIACAKKMLKAIERGISDGRE